MLLTIGGAAHTAACPPGGGGGGGCSIKNLSWLRESVPGSSLCLNSEASEVGWSGDFRLGGLKSSFSGSDLGYSRSDSWFLALGPKLTFWFLLKSKGEEFGLGCKFSLKIWGGIRICVNCAPVLGYSATICCLRRPRWRSVLGSCRCGDLWWNCSERARDLFLILVLVV